MKKWILDHFEDMTAQEIAAMQETQAQYEAEKGNREPTTEERITALEKELATTKILLGVE